MRKSIAFGALALVLLAGAAAFAQSAPPWGPNDSPTNANWLAFWGTKADAGGAGPSPNLTTGTCTGSGALGGTLAGRFNASVCTGGTFILSGLPTTPNGYACFASNRSLTTDLLVETSTSPTSATLTGTTAAGNVIQFFCAPY